MKTFNFQRGTDPSKSYKEKNSSTSTLLIFYSWSGEPNMVDYLRWPELPLVDHESTRMSW